MVKKNPKNPRGEKMIIVDIQEFQEEMEVDIEMAQELYEVFIEELLTEKETLLPYFRRGEIIDLENTMHNIKGISGSYRAWAVFKMAEEIYEQLKNRDIENMEDMLIRFRDLINETIKEIKKYFS